VLSHVYVKFMNLFRVTQMSASSHTPTAKKCHTARELLCC
jgi:hypothetical protein